LPFYPEVSRQGEWQRREFAYSRSLKRAAAVITGTEVGKLQLMQAYGISATNISVIPFPAQSPNVSKMVNRNSNSFFYPAQMWPHKNHINLLRGYAIYLNESREDSVLYLIGGDQGNLKHIQNEIDLLGISKNVIVTGFIEENQLYDYYSECTFMIYPSLFGPDNLPPLEALSFDCPVAVSDSPGAREQLKDSVYFFDPLSVSDIAKTIKLGFSDHFQGSVSASTQQDILSVNTLSNYLIKVETIVDSLRPHFSNWP
jgi:glycosyltransferase involved in cell wall biosynthesis